MSTERNKDDIGAAVAHLFTNVFFQPLLRVFGDGQRLPFWVRGHRYFEMVSPSTRCYVHFRTKLQVQKLLRITSRRHSTV